MTGGAGTAVFTAKTARVEKASFTIGRSRFQATADIASFAPMTTSYTVTSAEVWRADVQAAAPNAPKLPRPEVFRGVVVRGRTVETKPKVAVNEMEISSATGVVSNIDYTNATARVRATPDSVVIRSFDARALAGTVSGKGTMNPKASSFDIETHVANVNLAEYFRFKAPALVDVISGRINADFSISGAGKTWEDVQKTLAGKGNTVVLEGALLNVNLARQLLASIQSIPLLPRDLTARMEAKNPRLFASNATFFKDMTSNVTIADGKIQVPDLRLASSDLSIAGAGWISLGKDMSLNTTLTLSDQLTADLVSEVPAAKYLLASSGRMEIPLSFSGTVVKPALSVDSAALAARLQSSLVKEGQQGLNQQIKGLLDGLGKKKEEKKKP
jgi:hypothetical protein